MSEEKWYQIAASKLGTDEVRTGQIKISSISNAVAALGKHGWFIHRYYEIAEPQVGNPFLIKKSITSKNQRLTLIQ